MAIPILNTIDIKGKDVTADALLTQRKIATTWSRSVMPIIISPSKETSAAFCKTSPYCSRIGSNRISFSIRPLTMDESKSEGSGPQPNSTTTLTFPTSDKRSSSNGTAS